MREHISQDEHLGEEHHGDADVEERLARLMVEEEHAAELAEGAESHGNDHEDGFGDTALAVVGAMLVVAHERETYDVHEHKQEI